MLQLDLLGLKNKCMTMGKKIVYVRFINDEKYNQASD